MKIKGISFKFRDKLLSEWKLMLENEKYNFLKFMTTESHILRSKSQGLPGDTLSIENSIMIFNSSLTPLIIDPNTQATKWLQTVLGL